MKKNGFTIIEVVLVLAIAGLIFLMVFVALPSLQRSQKDAQRKQDVDRVAAALIQYQANGNRTLPGASSPSVSWSGNSDFGEDCNEACAFVKNYLNSAGSTTNEFKDPDGTFYNIYTMNSQYAYSAAGLTFANLADHTIYVLRNATCGVGDYNRNQTGKFAVFYKLEGSGVYCVDNN